MEGLKTADWEYDNEGNETIKEAYQAVAFVVGHICWKTGWESLLEYRCIAFASGIVHTTCEGDDLGRFSAWLYLLVAHGYEQLSLYEFLNGLELEFGNID